MTLEYVITCPKCGGTGKVYDARTGNVTPIVCPRCKGKGTIDEIA